MALLLEPHPHTALLRHATPPPRLYYTAPPPQLCYFATTLQLSYIAPPLRCALLLCSASPLLIKVVKGKILNSSTLNVLYEVDGHWDRTIKVKDSNNRKARVIYDAKEVINGLQAPIVKDAENLAESIDNAGLHDLFQKFGNILSSFGNCFGASNWFRRSDDSDTAEKPRERGTVQQIVAIRLGITLVLQIGLESDDSDTAEIPWERGDAVALKSVAYSGYTETLDQKSDIAVPEDDHGLNAIDILDPSIFTKCIYLTEVYHFCDIIDMLLGCGYKKGTTLLGYGSDFKQSNTIDKLMDGHKAKLETAYKVTGGRKVNLLLFFVDLIFINAFH
ncbi:hypothetical protein Ahy_B01g054694 [Arachis hypogaea]|uniref:Uncharacterized protein n=1 Tax=Arachis hypogaea TaxID=3818 RepID=A0A445AU73_ARAHY|nr:hypothetical protein Ahy_B01g054694 [Arachis hypogaea]